MAFIKNNFKQALILAVVLIAAFYLYSYFFSDKDGVKSLSVTTPAAVDNAVGKDLLLILADLRVLKLDEAIFSNPAFQNLKNFRTDLSPEPVGRDNPFAPTSGVSGGGTSPSGVQIKSFKTQ